MAWTQRLPGPGARVGEYTIVILSAKEANGLEAWLKDKRDALHARPPADAEADAHTK